MMEVMNYRLHSESNAISAKQSSKHLSEYYGELTKNFRELDHCDKIIMKDSKDVAAYWGAIDWLLVHIYLIGLDNNFEQVRWEIIRKDSILVLEEYYVLVW